MTDDPTSVLIVIDHVLLGETVALTLNHGVFDARVASTPVEALALLKQRRPLLAVIDMDLGDGALLDQLGIGGTDGQAAVPVIGLTRRGDLRTKLAAFEQGVDDILTIPFSPEELLARAVAVVRRAHHRSLAVNPTLHVGDIEIDILNREVRVGDSIIHLTGLEQSLLYLLAANAGRVIPREEIMDVVWGTDFVSESNVVDRHIRALRAKLQNDWRRPRFIATVPGRGYRFLPSLSAPVQTIQ
jgi:two-component system KDP operon response regulator KdpE